MDTEKLNILQLLIEHQEEDFSIRQISLRRKINYKSAYQAVQKLNKEGVIDLVKLGNTIICRFNRNFNDSVFMVEYYRRQELFKDQDFRVMYGRFKAVNNQFILLLFGSHAKKTQTKHSDIDFLLITNHPEEIKHQVSLLPLAIHLTHIKYADFQAMLRSKEFTVVSEAIKKNIILVGIEDYYRMVNNAQ
jgi:predicted nucleotidyltransferase